MLMTKGMPFCSATCAIAEVWPESKAPTSSCAPSLISFSARARANSTLVSVSAFIIANSGRPSSLKIAGAISTPRWQSCPMPACAPERGSSTPTFNAPAWARAMRNGALPASRPPAAAPAAKLRREMPARARFGEMWVIAGPPGVSGDWQQVPYFSYAARRYAMGQKVMEDKTVLIEQHPGYCVVTLNRPQRLNAFSEAMHGELKRAIDAAESDGGTRALLLTGAGRAFCAGQDLSERVSADGQATVLGSSLETWYNPLVRRLRALPFPVVAAVNGVAAGAGANIALACDIVLAARSASFVQAFAKIGLIPDCGGTWFLPRLVGPARARGLALTAEPLPADKAEAWGLIWKTFDDSDLMAQGHQLCVQFTAAPTVALALIKRALDEAWGNDLDAQLDLERESQREASLTPDYAEGVRAFLQKRLPAFTGRRAP